MASSITLDKVTTAQYRVLRLIRQGFSITEIAEELDLNYYTVREHVRNLRDRGFVQTARGRRSQVTVDLRRVRPRNFRA
jgi:DNA-binding NarL/FixJ family response regulator